MKMGQLIFLAALMALISFILQKNHLLMALLTLEASMLLLMVATMYEFSDNMANMTYIMYLIMVMAACEAALALSVLVLLSRFKGSDSMKLSSLNKC